MVLYLKELLRDLRFAQLFFVMVSAFVVRALTVLAKLGVLHHVGVSLLQSVVLQHDSLVPRACLLADRIHG